MTGFSARQTARPVVQPAEPRPPVVPQLMTVAEVADLLHVSKMTVYRLVDAGELRGLRIGRSVRIPEPELQEYLRSAEVGR